MFFADEDLMFERKEAADSGAEACCFEVDPFKDFKDLAQFIFNMKSVFKIFKMFELI